MPRLPSTTSAFDQALVSDPVQDSPSQCQIRPGQDSQGTQGENSELVCFGMVRDMRFVFFFILSFFLPSFLFLFSSGLTNMI